MRVGQTHTWSSIKVGVFSRSKGAVSTQSFDKTVVLPLNRESNIVTGLLFGP